MLLIQLFPANGQVNPVPVRMSARRRVQRAPMFVYSRDHSVNNILALHFGSQKQAASNWQRQSDNMLPPIESNKPVSRPSGHADTESAIWSALIDRGAPVRSIGRVVQCFAST